MNRSNLILLNLMLCIFIVSSCSDDTQYPDETNNTKIETRQYGHEDGPGWTPCEIADLKIFLPEGCTDLYEQAFLDAANNFSNIQDAGINITITNNEEEADITVSCFFDDTSQNGGSIGSELDDEGKSARIFVNNSLNLELFGCDQSELDLCGATKIAMHEIFHALGFYHDGDDNSHSELIEGTPENDPNSILLEGTDPNFDWCNLTCEFSEFDIIALQNFYPCACSPLRRKTGYGYFCEIGEIKTFCAPSSIDIREWEIPANLDLISTDGNCITVQVNNLNTVTNLIAHLDNNTCGFKFTFEINTLEEPNFDISWNDPVCLGDVVKFTIDPITPQELNVIQWSVVSGGLNIMSSNEKFAIAEALYSGSTTICATAINECGNTHQYCRTVNVRSDRDCGEGDGEIPNPK